MTDDALNESVEVEESLDDAIAAEMAKLEEPETEPESTEEVPEEPAEAVAEETTEAEPEEETPAEPEALKPYDHWREDYKQAFSQMPREAQEKWIEREKDFERGFQAKAQELNQAKQFLQQFHGMVSPHVQHWQRQGMSVPQAMQRLVALDQHLRENPAEALMTLAKERGVDLQKAWQEQPYVDPAVSQVQKDLEQTRAQLKQFEAQREQEAQRQQQAARQEAFQQITAMREATDESGNPRYPHLQHMIGNMASAMESGRANNLDAAYHIAVQEMKNHPLIRDVLEKQTAQVQQNRQATVEKAKKAAKVVDSNDTTSVPVDRSLDEDIAEALAAAGID